MTENLNQFSRNRESLTNLNHVSEVSDFTFPDGTYVLGAPEFVLLEKFDGYAEKIEEYASAGARVLGVRPCLFGMTLHGRLALYAL